MNTEDKLYRDLQIHLDEQTIGFPATESGSDIRLLKQLFHPEEAETVTLLTYKYEALEQIHERGKKIGKSIKEIERVLDKVAKRGVIGYRENNGVKQYQTIPYIVGMLEAGLHKPTPEFIAAHIEYSGDGAFYKDFINTKVPQMRTIPIEKSIKIEHHIGSYDEITNIIKTTEEPIAILECVCREGAERRGEPCKQTSRKETCMVFHDGAKNLIERGHARKLSKEEALDIIGKNEEENLVLQPSNAQGPDFVCSCCGCCCGILRVHRAVPNPVDIWATNFYAEVNPDLCTGCGTCEESCQTGAMILDEEEGISVVDLTRCLGCGLCVSSCPDEAVVLQKKEMEVIPPQTGEEMFEVIMSNKLRAVSSER
jgi:electron transport complex protein RnfB